jgi:hypothetical protein
MKINPYIRRFTYFVFRQADYISQVAAIDGSLSGIEHWWIGLTDLGK